MNDRQSELLKEHMRGFFKPEPDCPVWLWAENNVILSSLESADMSGKFSSAVTPFIREPLECFRNPQVHEVTLVFATQVCKTLMIMLGVAWWLEHHAGRCIWVMDSKENALSFSETRWQPLINDCSALAAMMPSDRHQFKNMQQRMGASIINFVGSNSPGNLSQRPADLLVMDEVDKFAVTTAREANAVDLAEQRTKARTSTTIIKTSSPTTTEGLIWKSFLAGDQRQYFLPCPHCGEFILLEFENVKWDPAAKYSKGWNLGMVMQTARYRCQKCGGEIHDGQKTAMLRDGQWRPTNPHAAPGQRSYHLNSLYSPWAKTTFGNLAVEFLKHKERYDMKGWDNGYMARPTEEKCERVDWELLATRREAYAIGELEEPATRLPAGVAVLTAFCDVQDTWLEWFVWGWGEGSENWLIEHQRIEGPPSQRYTWAALRQTILAARPLPLDWTFIDYGGHFGQEAIEFCRQMATHRVYLGKGDEARDCPVNGRIGKTKKPVTRLFHTGVGNAKRRLFAMMNNGEKGPGYCHFSDQADDEFFKQLCAEELRTKYEKGSPIEYFFQTRPRNEALDGFVGCYAGLKRLPDGTLRRRYAALKSRRSGTGDQKTGAGKPNRPVRKLRRGGGYVNNW